MTAGLLLAGDLHQVAGINVIPPASHGGPAWAALDPGDYTMRRTPWIRQVVVHTTGGLWPQHVIPGAGDPGHARQIADMWRGADRGGGERVHSAAQIVVDFNGDVVCLCDLLRVAAYHAEGSNPWSVGIEMSTHADGSIQQATLDATAVLVATLTHGGRPDGGLLPIPFQGPRGPYRNQPLARMETGSGPTRHQLGGPDVVGVVGHRDNTSERGYGDPGNAIWAALAALGIEGVDYDGGEDLVIGRARQAALNTIDARRGNTLSPLVVDGVVGPSSLATMRRLGFVRWRDVA